MRFVINTNMSSVFEETLEKAKQKKAEIELHYLHAKKRYMNIPEVEKAKINSIEGNIRDYKYLTFLGQSLGCEYILFHPEKKDLEKMEQIIVEGSEKGVEIAIDNHPKLGRTATDFYNILKRLKGAKFVFNPAYARLKNQHAKGFMNMLKDEIIAVSVCDIYNKKTGLPYSLGEKDFLDSVIKELRKEVPFVIRLDPKYRVQDALISIDKMAERSKHLKSL